MKKYSIIYNVLNYFSDYRVRI